jgi:hypothetical protein
MRDRYQKKRLAGKAIRKSMKIKGRQIVSPVELCRADANQEIGVPGWAVAGWALLLSLFKGAEARTGLVVARI